MILRPEIPFAELEAKYAGAASRFMDLPDGLRVHYRDQGAPDGPPIVLIHGFGASLLAWEPWIERLGDSYRMVSLDLPGHGLTRAPSAYAMSLPTHAGIVAAVAERLGLRRYVAAGASMGGGVVWTLALAHPDQLRALVLIDPVGGAGARGGPPRAASFLLATPPARALFRRLNLRPMIRRGLRVAYADERLVTDDLVDAYDDFSRGPGRRDMLLNSRQPAAPSPSAFALIRTPTLVLHGEADRVIPLAAGTALARAIPGTRLVTYPGAGHLPMEQIPDQSAADVRAFLLALGTEEAAAARVADPARGG